MERDAGHHRVSRPASDAPDHIVTLRARTVTIDGPGRRKRRVVNGPAEFAAVLHEQFGNDPAALGEERLTRLWTQAVAQREAHVSND